MGEWQRSNQSINFQISDWTLFSAKLPLNVRSVGIADDVVPSENLTPPSDGLEPGIEGFCLRAQPVASVLPRLSKQGDFLCYVPKQYRHCYIDLRLTFDQYQQKFSSKTRSTINRKIKKFAEHSGGTINWKSYRTKDEILEFYEIARRVSSTTYQEKLLDVGLPDSEDFRREMIALAEQDLVRAYVLFDRERPVSYLYCPNEGGVLIYAYLGYDPEYMKLSVGTVLQWLAIQQIYEENKFKFFDFTEGESEHKRLFSTNNVQCANVYFLRNTFKNRLLTRSHSALDSFSSWLGVTMDSLGVKTKIKRFIRFAR